jgi:hypothetical protein
MAAVQKRVCANKDCGKRNAIPPARLCPTCKRKNKAASKAKSHDKYVQETYGLAPGEYEALLELQGGVCYICKGGKSSKRRLAVDHDHETGKPRGLLCRNCNYVWLGRMLKDKMDRLLMYFTNTRDYLDDPPYDRMVRGKQKG